MYIQFHRHRIIPGHMGGTYEPSNVIRVNIAMHAFLHEQLWKQYGHIEDKLAYEGLRGLISKDEIIARIHKLAGLKISLAMKGRPVPIERRKRISATLKGRLLTEAHRRNIAAGGIGRVCAETTRIKIRAANMGKPGHVAWNKGKSGYTVNRVNGIGWHHNEEFKERTSDRMIGNQYAVGHKHTDEWKAATSARQLGRTHVRGWKHSEDAKARISAGMKGKKFSAESIAKRTASRQRKRAIREQQQLLEVKP